VIIFSKNSMQFLERTYLSSGKVGLDSLKKHLLKLFLLTLGSDDEYLRDMQILHYQDKVQDIVQEAIFNPIACYTGVFKSLPNAESAKPDLHLKIERFLAKVGEVKRKGRNTLPKFIQDDLAKKIATQNRQGVPWLLHHAVVAPKDNNRFEGRYGVVRMVEIHEVEAIPPYIEFAGKTMKLKNNLDHRKSRSTEALQCPVDHPGVIKVMYLDRRTYESFTLWWNGGSLFAMRHYDRKYKQDQHKSELLRSPGPDYEARKRLVLYRKKRAHLAWALMNIMAAVSVEDVLHDNLSLNNVFLHFPINDDNVVNIGVCDWGLATWTGEVVPSLYGKPNDTQLDKAKKRCNWIAPELFHLIGELGSTTFPRRAGKAHACRVLSDSYTVGMLPRRCTWEIQPPNSSRRIKTLHQHITDLSKL
jgi:hypothetical protein